MNGQQNSFHLPNNSAHSTEGKYVPRTEEITAWGRRIHGPTLPGGGVRCKRETPLNSKEIAEIAAIIVKGRTEHHSVSLPDNLKTRNWESVMAVMERVNEILAWPSAGWKIGAASEEIRRAEGVPSPAPGQLLRRGVFASPARLPAELFINYRCSECEFAFKMRGQLRLRERPYEESEVADYVEALFPALEIGDSVFEDWYGASGFQGTSMDNGGAAAFVYGAPVFDWRNYDLSKAKIDLYLNGQYMKSGFGRAAMGNPLTSLTWLANWLRERGKVLQQGEFVSTGTCTGHFFAAPGDRLEVDFCELGKVLVEYE